MGGFNGTDPASTLEQFKRYGAEKKIHYFIGAGMGGSDDAARIAEWVGRHSPRTIEPARAYWTRSLITAR
ncbi:hypothetical protein [Nonomuraea sp. NPDC050202]|uniref:hypothetical protein n=1 Tax=Nonomuraea sp. NPDC050202 TaxID=3155035 RepID=UPI00340F0B82